MTKSVAEYDFMDAGVIECPYDFYAAAREEAPVYEVPGAGIYLISRYDDVRKVLADTGLFSSNFADDLNVPPSNPEAAALYETGYETVNTLLTLDPPRHRVYRSLVNKVFSNSRVEGMTGYIEAMVTELIDSWIDDGEVDMLNRFCIPLPVNVIADQLGVPRSDVGLFKLWSDASASRLSQFADHDKQLEDAKLVLEYQRYFKNVIEERRKEPQDNIISDLAHARIDDGRLLDMGEILSILQQLLVAGNETTTSAIAGGIYELAQHPDQLQKLQDDPSLIPNAVEEIVRYESPTAGIWRKVTRDTELGGTALPEGAMVMIRYASANRDERVFDDAERVDVCRHNAGDNLSFGRGVHFCLGAQLARKEMVVAFEHLIARTGNWQLAPGKNTGTHWPNMLLRGLKELHITFDKR
ncbi:MAG: cytochrome P450 [Halioglobus sp.]